MELNETIIRTVPPRAKGYGVFGVLGGVILTAALLWGWRAMLPAMQRSNLFLYAKSSALSLVSIESFTAKPGKMTRNEYVEQLLRTRVYSGESLLMFCFWPLVVGGCVTFGLLLVGVRADQKFMRELRAGRLLAGPRLVSRAFFNEEQRKKSEQPGVGLLLKNQRSPGEIVAGQEGYILRIPKRHESHHFSIAGRSNAYRTRIPISSKCFTDAAMREPQTNPYTAMQATESASGV